MNRRSRWKKDQWKYKQPIIASPDGWFVNEMKLGLVTGNFGCKNTNTGKSESLLLVRVQPSHHHRHRHPPARQTSLHFGRDSSLFCYFSHSQLSPFSSERLLPPPAMWQVCFSQGGVVRERGVFVSWGRLGWATRVVSVPIGKQVQKCKAAKSHLCTKRCQGRDHRLTMCLSVWHIVVHIDATIESHEFLSRLDK